MPDFMLMTELGVIKPQMREIKVDRYTPKRAANIAAIPAPYFFSSFFVAFSSPYSASSSLK